VVTEYQCPSATPGA